MSWTSSTHSPSSAGILHRREEATTARWKTVSSDFLRYPIPRVLQPLRSKCVPRFHGRHGSFLLPFASLSSSPPGSGGETDQIQELQPSEMAKAFHISSGTASAICVCIIFAALSFPMLTVSMGLATGIKAKALSYVTLLLGFYMAWNIGANDVANAMGTSVGSGALTLRQAVVTAAVLEFSGALLMGKHVTSTMQKGILVADVFRGNSSLLFAGLLSSLAAAGTWLQVASFYGWPVSTTHCIVGSMVGFGLVFGGTGAVFWKSLARVTSSWVISPFMGAAVSFIVYKCIRRVRLRPLSF